MDGVGPKPVIRLTLHLEKVGSAGMAQRGTCFYVTGVMDRGVVTQPLLARAKGSV